MSPKPGRPYPGSHMSTPFPFFVGANGSGTTLHRAIFDSHADLAIPGESQFIVDLAPSRSHLDGGFDLPVFISDLKKHKRFLNWGLSVDDVAMSLTTEAPITYSDAIRTVYETYARSEGKARYGDKTQSYIHSLPLLADLFPEAKFVHAVRDGRNVALAHAKGEKIEQVAASWSRRVQEGRRAGTSLGPERYIESRYEDLIDDTEGAVRRLCEFLDLDFKPEMLRYYERAESVIANTAVPERHLDIYKPPTKGLQDWTKELSESQVGRFESIAGETLVLLGYQRSVERLPVTTRVTAWANLAGEGARIAAKRATKRMGR